MILTEARLEIRKWPQLDLYPILPFFSLTPFVTLVSRPVTAIVSGSSCCVKPPRADQELQLREDSWFYHEVTENLSWRKVRAEGSVRNLEAGTEAEALGWARKELLTCWLPAAFSACLLVHLRITRGGTTWVSWVISHQSRKRSTRLPTGA